MNMGSFPFDKRSPADFEETSFGPLREPTPVLDSRVTPFLPGRKPLCLSTFFLSPPPFLPSAGSGFLQGGRPLFFPFRTYSVIRAILVFLRAFREKPIFFSPRKSRPFPKDIL